MFKLLITVNALLAMLTSPVSPPEIWAEPVPYFLENQMGNYVVPHSERGPGHRGVDFASENQPILSPTSAVISFNAKVANRNVVTLATGRYKISFEPVCGQLDVGSGIQKGEVLGNYCLPDSDYLEHCESCAHMSVRSARGYLNPLLFYGKLAPSKIVG